MVSRARGEVREDIIFEGENRAARTMRDVSDNLEGVGKKLTFVSLGASAVASAIDSIGESITEAAAQADQFDILKADLDDVEGLISRVRKSSADMIPRNQIVQAAANFQSFGLDVGQLDRALAAASNTAIRTGGDLEKLTDSLVTGIARESPAILDNLGVVVSLEEAKLAAAKATGKLADELSASERKAGLLAVTLEKLEASNINVRLTDSRTASIKRLEAAWDDLISSGKTFLSDVAVGVVDFFIGVSEQTARWGEELGEIREDLPETVGVVADAATDAMRHIERTAAATISRLQSVMSFAKEAQATTEMQRRAELAAAEAARKAAGQGRAEINSLLRIQRRASLVNSSPAQQARARGQLLEAMERHRLNVLVAGEKAFRAQILKEQGALATLRAEEAEKQARIAAEAQDKTAEAEFNKRKGGRSRAAKAAREWGEELGSIFGAALARGMEAIDDQDAEGGIDTGAFDALAAKREKMRADLGLDKDNRSDLDRTLAGVDEAQSEGFISALEANAVREQAVLEARLGQWQKFGAGLQDASAALRDSQDDVVASLGAGLEALNAHFDTITKGAPGAIAASGAVLGAFFSDQTAKYALMAIGEGAEAIAAFARYDYWAGAKHTAAAALFGVAAGTAAAGGSGGRGGSARSGGGPRGQLNRPIAQQQQASNAPINIFVNSPMVGGSAQEIGHQLGRFIVARNATGMRGAGAA